MSAKHTPGPWVVRGKHYHGQPYGGLWVEAVDPEEPDGRRRIKITGSGGARSYSTEVVEAQIHDDNDANAHLIAAAPEMLDALRDGLARIEASDEWWMGSPNRGGFDVEKIRAAIAKAEGKQP